MKKARLLAAVLALAVLLLSLGGCSPAPQGEATTAEPVQTPAADAPAEPAPAQKEWFGEADGVTPVTLQIWGGVQPEYGYDKMAENFNAAYKDKGIQIEYVRYVNDADGNLQVDTYLVGGGAIDVLIGYGANNLQKRAESGLLLNLTDRLHAREFDCAKELGEASMSQYWVNGDQVYGFPSIYSNNRWMMVNVDMFQEANLPVPYEGWSYDSFYNACKALTKGEGINKRYGMMWCINQDIAQARGVASSVLGEAAFYASQDGTASNFDNPAWHEGVSLIKKTMDDGYAIPLADEVADSLNFSNTFLAEKCAISLNISQIRLLLDTATYPHEFKTALVPGPVPNDYMRDEYKYHTNYSGTNDLLSITASTPHPEAAFEFIMWYATGGMAPVAEFGRIPLWRGFDASLVTNALSGVANILDLDSLAGYMNVDKSAAVNMPALKAYSEITTVINEEIQAILLGSKTAEQGLSDAKARADALIASK